MANFNHIMSKLVKIIGFAAVAQIAMILFKAIFFAFRFQTINQLILVVTPCRWSSQHTRNCKYHKAYQRNYQARPCPFMLLFSHELN